jgi:hypothetical protein
MNLPRRLFAILIFSFMASSSDHPAFALGEKPHVSTILQPGSFPLAQQQSLAALYVDKSDWPGVSRAVNSFASDLAQVTGRTAAIIHEVSGQRDLVLVGTIGKSVAIDRLIAQGKLDVSSIRGHWETSVTQIVEHPFPGVRSALVIAGADKRGTIYGIYDLSEQIGVSPWAWWADVPVLHKNALYVIAGRYVQPEPRVKYRGIFLNDEAPSLTGWVDEKFGGYNSKFYTHVFDLLLRLKANFLWPAMWNSSFSADDPLNPKLADEYGIVMSTSHEEPMMRAEKEWTSRGAGPWDYTRNAQAIDEFWRIGMERNKNYENVVTLGMRGDGDTPMSEGTNIQLLEKIVADQRQILKETVNPDLTKVPQVWALYKEVQTYYEKGMRVPDDVTLLWSDDNWGDLRRVPTMEERKRSGGAGIYYHFDYVGGPRNYKWLNTNPIPKIWDQMHLADEYGADRIWVVNVGDLKPLEFPIEFFLDLARTPDRWGKDNLDEFTRLWAAREFGPEHASEIARIMIEYTRYNGRRKPELIDADTFSNQPEANQMLADYKDTVARAEKLYTELPVAYRDAFFELVLFPAKASEVVLEINIDAGKNHLYARQGRVSTNDLANRVRTLFAEDAQLAGIYNHDLANGKWSHMMDQTHLGYFTWQEPPVNAMPAVTEVQPLAGAHLGAAAVGGPGGFRPALPAFDPFNNQTGVIDIFNRGTEPARFTATASEPWIKLGEASGIVKADRSLSVNVDWSQLPTGTATGNVTIAQPGATGRPTVVSISALKPASPTVSDLHGFVESNGVVSVEAEHYTALHAGKDATWQKIPDYGETLSGMSVFPVTAPSSTDSANAACMDYTMYLFDSGPVSVESVLAPTMAFVPGRGLRYSIALDAQPAVTVDAWASNTQQDWATAVSDGVHKVATQASVDRPGYHTLHFCMVDPGVVLEKLVISRGNQPFTYLGPPESFHR